MTAATAQADLQAAHARFLEALAQSPKTNSLAVDGSIQRFEFTFELLWKWLKIKLLEDEGLDVNSPKRALTEAHRLGWTSDEALWLAMLQDRNLTSHTYVQSLAVEIYGRLPRYADAIAALLAGQ